MTDQTLYPVPSAIAAASHCDDARYQEMYRQSVDDPEAFWAKQAKRLDWVTFPTKIKDVDYADQARIRWYEDGILNVCHNCVDRHLEKRGDQTAILWEGDEPDQDDLERDLLELMDQHLYLPLAEVDLGRLLEQVLDIVTRHNLSLKPNLFLMIKAIMTCLLYTSPSPRDS